MRSFIFVVAVLMLSSCAITNQSAQREQSCRTVAAEPLQAGGGCASHTLEANELFERLPTDGLYVRFRVSPGWRVTQIQHNYIAFRSMSDSAFITVWDDDGSVQWGLTYHMLDRELPVVCRLGYTGRPNEAYDSETDYRSYMDDTDEPAYVYVNWPDYDGIQAFADALALREGGHCRPVR